MPDRSLLHRTRPFLVISLLTLIAFALLYIFRSMDDNRLTSWKWAFANADPQWFLMFIIVGIVITYGLFKVPVAEQRPAWFLFIFSFAASTIFWRMPEVIVDVSRYFTQAKHLEIYGIEFFVREWGKTINAWTDLPLVPFLYGIIFNVFGESRIYIQILNSTVFSMTVVVTYLTGKTLWNKDTGLVAGALLMGIPYLYSQTPLMLVDIQTMFFLALSVFTFIKALEQGGSWIAFSSAAIFSAVFSKYSTWMMLSVLGVIFLVYLKQGSGWNRLVPRVRDQGAGKGKQILYRGSFVALITASFIGVVLIFKYDVISGQIGFLREYQAPGLRRWSESFTSTFLYQIHPFITLAALYAVYEAFRKRDLKFLIISWLIILIIALQIRRSRYVLIVFPMYALMASYGLQKIKSINIRRYVTSCIVGSSLVVSIGAYMPFLQTMSLVNIKDAGSYLNTLNVEAVKIFTVNSRDTVVNQAVSVPILDFFTDKQIYYSQDTGFRLPFEEVKESPLRFTWEYKNPNYYKSNGISPAKKPAIAVISNGPLENLPDYITQEVEGYRKAATFKGSTGIFRYSPAVTVYRP